MEANFCMWCNLYTDLGFVHMYTDILEFVKMELLQNSWGEDFQKVGFNVDM